MYCAEKIKERLDEAEKMLGYRPVYHSVEEVDAVNKRLEAIALRDSDGKPVGGTTRPYTENEKWWIRNERMLCMCDAEYFLTRYAYLKGDKNEIVRFKFRNPQKVYFSVISSLEKRGASIQLQILKGRQLGVSTITELLVAHRILFTYGVNAVIASSQQQQTALMSNMIFLVYDYLPYWLKPPFTRRVESDKGQFTFGGIQSGVSFQHGSQTSGIARGHTPTVVHISEVASFSNAEELIDASLFRAVHESENVFMVLESTAEGIDNWWHKTWKLSKEGWNKGKSKLCPLFLPWFLGTEMYPKPVWLATRPVPEDWVPNKDTRMRMAKAKAYVQSSEVLHEVLGKDWEMGKDQAWFSEVDYEEYRAKGREKLWKQEMAGDDIEAFQGSFDSVFGNDLLDELHETRDKNYGIYNVIGHGIHDSYCDISFQPDPDEIDYRKDQKIVHFSSNKGDLYKWTLVPLKPDVIDEDNKEASYYQVDGKLLIFREPEEGFDYTIGVDTGGGVGKDSTVIAVWRKGMRGAPDFQCAEFASAVISHNSAYPFAMAIAAYYSRYMRDGNSQYREPLMSIEQIAAVGDTVQSQMRLMGYGRFFRFHQYDTKVIKRQNASKMGWRTSGWSRPLLVDGFVDSVKNGWLIINSPFLLRDMSQFEVHVIRGKEKFEHSSEAHDDRIFASAIAVFTSHDMEKMVDRAKNRPTPMHKSYKPQINLTPLGGHVFNTGRDSIADTMVNVKTTKDLEEFIASERLGY